MPLVWAAFFFNQKSKTMFANKMHFLFTLRKKHIEKFVLSGIYYPFFKAASSAYDRNEALSPFFESIKLSEKAEDLPSMLTRFGIEVPDEQNEDNWQKRIMNKKPYIMLFYDEQGKYIGEDGMKRGRCDVYEARRKFIRKNAVWMWLLDAKFKEKISNDEDREKLLSKGRALGPYEMWVYWLNVAG